MWLIINEVLQWLAIAFLFWLILQSNKTSNHNFSTIFNKTSHLMKY